jgi:hydrogenase expression/formation protein HypE
MPIRGVLFDFDGTLTRPGSLDFEAMKKALGFPQEYPILEYLNTLGEGDKFRALALLEQMENEAARNSVPNRGAVSLLTWLKKRLFPFGLVTRNGIQSVRLALRTFRPLTESDFAVIITRDDAPPKPEPEGLLLAAQRMNLEPENILFVGDYRFDVLAGTAAGMVTALITNGCRPTLRPEDPRPRYEIVHLEEVFAILKQNL